jgi:aspartate/methionine/tyrosine aminotransferase
MKIDQFRMERTQCLYENEVEFNLSESGVSPLSIAELVPDPGERAALEAQPLRYPHSTGRERLRANIAAFHGLADAAGVMVTNGGSEANYTTLWGLIEPGDRVAFMVPNYLQAMGLGNAWGRQVDRYRLVMKRDAGGRFRWQLDIDSLRRAVTRKTRAIFVTNPNNPTGAVLSDAEMQAIIEAANRVGAWIVSDEIYRGAETNGPLSPTFADRYERAVVTGGLSKAFGLPGLRTGWIVAPRKLVEHLCQYHDYLTLTPSFLSDYLADVVMQAENRERILARTRSIIRRNLPTVEDWIESHADFLQYARPAAGAICTVRYRLPVASETLFNRFRREQSVLITPGAHFGIGKYLRIGFGYDRAKTAAGLARLDRPLKELKKRQAKTSTVA